MDACPAELRREIHGEPCGRCGGNGCGREIAVKVDGQERLACYFGIQWIRQWEPSHIEPLKRLLSAQDALYRAA
jgi:succinate dehydrogenase/fumarate reductase-like Fe-S protein